MRMLIRDFQFGPLYKSPITWVLLIMLAVMTSCTQFMKKAEEPTYPPCEVSTDDLTLKIEDLNEPPISALHPGSLHLVMVFMEHSNTLVQVPLPLLDSQTAAAVLHLCYAPEAKE